MAENNKQYEYVLPVGTILTSNGSGDGKKRSYTIEQVVNGKPLRKGQKLQKDDVVRPVLGQGGYGITYLASRRIKDGNIDLGTAYYAIKEFFIKGSCYREEGIMLMRYSPAAEKEVKESLRDFKEEAIRLKEICKGNPHIVNVNEVFEANGTAYYVMEFIEGESLRSLVKRNGPLSEGVALSYIRPIAQAVAYIHTQHRLLHLDIKPDNIMLRESSDGRLKEPVLIDFGVSVHFNKKGELTTTHSSVGISEGYSPREQYGGVAKIVEDRKRKQSEGLTTAPLIPCEVDVYALGATLYYTLVGADPYGAFSMSTSIANTKLPQTISRKTRQVVIDAMQPDAECRTRSAEAFLKGFEDRYTLPMGYVLHSDNANYMTTDLQEETDCYIRYGAVPYFGKKERMTGNTTKTIRYVVYEMFNKAACERRADESVNISQDAADGLSSSFKNTCRKLAGLSEEGTSDVQDNIVVREVFAANGTVYAVVKQGWKPVAPVVQLTRNTVNHFIRNKKQYGKVVLSLALVSLLGFLGYKFISTNAAKKEELQMRQAQLSLMLNTAIERNDSTALVQFAEADSARAYLPLAYLCLNANDTVASRKYAERAIRNGENEGNNVIREIEKMNALQQANVTEKEKELTKNQADNAASDVNSPKKGNNEEKAEVKKQKEPTLVKTDEKKPQETQADKQKMEQKEAASKAMQYINSKPTKENHQQAYKWAQKADPATKAEVMRRLKEYGFPIP